MRCFRGAQAGGGSQLTRCLAALCPKPTIEAYCNKLGALASRYIGSAGAEGRMAPDLNVLGAIDDCNKGRTDKAIPYLEKRLRDNGITLPPR